MTNITNLPIIPDYVLSDEFSYYLTKNCIVFNNKFIIKELDATLANLEVLNKIINLNLPGYLHHEKIFTNEEYDKIYLASKYNSNCKDFRKHTFDMNISEILSIYKQILIDLKNAHTNGFNPYDVKLDNFILDSNNRPLFIDFDLSIYNGECTKNHIIDLNEFIILSDYGVTSINKDSFNLHDKISVLYMLLQSLSKTYFSRYGDVNKFEETFNALKEKYLLDPEVDKKISLLLSKECVLFTKEDYLIDTVIEPLKNGGLILKR